MRRFVCTVNFSLNAVFALSAERVDMTIVLKKDEPDTEPEKWVV